MSLEDINYVHLLPQAGGWPNPFWPELRRGQDFREAFVDDKGSLWILFANGSRVVVPLAHVLFYEPSEWP